MRTEEMVKKLYIQLENCKTEVGRGRIKDAIMALEEHGCTPQEVGEQDEFDELLGEVEVRSYHDSPMALSRRIEMHHANDLIERSLRGEL